MHPGVGSQINFFPAPNNFWNLTLGEVWTGHEHKYEVVGWAQVVTEINSAGRPFTEMCPMLDGGQVVEAPTKFTLHYCGPHAGEFLDQYNNAVYHAQMNGA